MLPQRLRNRPSLFTSAYYKNVKNHWSQALDFRHPSTNWCWYSKVERLKTKVVCHLVCNHWSVHYI